MLILCYAAVLKILTYYAQYYGHECLKFDCSIRVYRSLLIFLTKHFLLCWHYIMLKIMPA